MTRRVLNPWVQRVADGLDDKIIHDYASTKRGIEAGVAQGIFEIQSHGWTHMLPDVEPAPGPWWDAPMDGVGSLDWYNEFSDRLRDREIPAATQRDHLRRSIRHLREDFGTTPLVVRPGGSAYSRSFTNNTALVALAWASASPHGIPLCTSRPKSSCRWSSFRYVPRGGSTGN